MALLNQRPITRPVTRGTGSTGVSSGAVSVAARRPVHGWGGAPVGRSEWAEVVDVAQAAEVVASSGERGVIARGLGRSYGDAAQNSGGTVVRLRPSGAPIRPDVRGRVTLGAGESLDEVLRQIVPQGWFVPVSPGTRSVTVGGAIAAHVHGKNHHVDGSFGAHVRSLRLLVADGSVRDITPESDPDLWWATIGGMGLTGIVIDATVDLLPIESSRCVVDTGRLGDLDELMAAMVEGDHRYRYSVAWIDLVATGRHLGRSVLTRGDHARADQLPAGRDPLEFAPRQLASVPAGTPNLLTPLGVRAFNEAWYRRAPMSRTGELQSIAQFFHPLDAVGHWNRLYGRRGFLQYQFVVPETEDAALRQVVERVARSGHASFLAVLKRFGHGDEAMLGFPRPGWTLTLDLPTGAHGLGPLLTELDEIVLTAGGRHYLAKDAATTAAAVRAGYPMLERWRSVRRRVDPAGVWASDLARRLDLL